MLNWLKSLFGTKPASNDQAAAPVQAPVETPAETPVVEEAVTDLTGEPLVAQEEEAAPAEEEVE
jgi:hypothetical protein